MTVPDLTALLPNNATVGTASLTMRCIGSSFEPGAVIVWNEGDEPTTYVNDTEVTTGVNPTTASGYRSVLVYIRNPGGESSNALAFTFYEQDYCPVTAQEVADVLGPNVQPDDRLESATRAACRLARQFLDPIEPWQWPDPLPDSWHEGIIGLAMDLYRAPTLSFGYFATDVGVAPTGPDLMRRWRGHFSNDRMGWGFA